MFNATAKGATIIALILGVMFIINGTVYGMDPVKLTKLASSKPFIELGIDDMSKVIINNQGYTYLLDSGKASILRFDRNLNLINRFGARGQGPGEFNMGYSLNHDKDDNIYIIDSMKKILQYNAKGAFVEEQRFTDLPSLSRGYVLRKPYIAGIVFNFKIPGYDIQFLKKGSKVPVGKASITCRPNYSLRLSGGGMIAPAVPFVGGHSFTDYWGDMIVIGEGERYDVRLFDYKGKLLTRIKRDHEAPELKDDERNILVEKVRIIVGGRFTKASCEKLLGYYKKKNFISGLKLTKNKIFIFLVPSRITKSTAIPVEVYDFKGKLVSKLQFPRVPLRIEGHELIMKETKETDDDEITRLVKYRYSFK